MATSTAVAPSTRIARASLIVLVLINIVNFYDRNVGGALAEPMRREFGLSDTQLGLLGTVFTVLYAVMGCRWDGSLIAAAVRNCWLQVLPFGGRSRAWPHGRSTFPCW